MYKPGSPRRDDSKSGSGKKAPEERATAAGYGHVFQDHRGKCMDACFEAAIGHHIRTGATFESMPADVVEEAVAVFMKQAWEIDIVALEEEFEKVKHRYRLAAKSDSYVMLQPPHYLLYSYLLVLGRASTDIYRFHPPCTDLPAVAYPTQDKDVFQAIFKKAKDKLKNRVNNQRAKIRKSKPHLIITLECLIATPSF